MKLSPEVIASEVQDDKVILTLDQPIQPGELHEFELGGDANGFYNADATADGNRIIVKATNEMQGWSTVRYAWKDDPQKANVRSLTGLPMSSFKLKVK